MRCPACDGLSVLDFKKAIKFIVIAFLPLLLVTLLLMLVPLERWVIQNPNWIYAIPILTSLMPVYVVCVVWMVNAKVPLTPYRYSRKTMAKQLAGSVLLAGAIISMAWLALR